MKFKLEIDCDNAAFEDDLSGELATILDTVSNMVMGWRSHGSIGEPIGPFPLRDSNGNTVGMARLTV